MKFLILICLALAVVAQVSARKPHFNGRQQLNKRTGDKRRTKPNLPTSVRDERPRIPDIKSRLPIDMQSRIPTSDRPRVPGDVRPRIPGGVRPRIPGDVRPRIPGDVRPRIPGAVRPRIPSLIEDHVNGIMCDTCMEVVTELESLLKSLDEDQIVSMLSGICDELKLPGNFSAECKEIVQEYVPIIFELIDSLDPKTTCTELTLCSEEDIDTSPFTKFGMNSEKFGNSLRKFKALDRMFVSVKERIQKNLIKRFVGKIFDDDVVCQGCKQTVQFIHDLLTNNETVSDIVSALEMVCQYLPEEFQKSCDDYIELIPEVLATIANTYFIPEKDCKAVGLCTGDVDVMIPELPDIDIEPEMPVISELPQIPAAFSRGDAFDIADLDNLPTQINKHKKKLPSKATRYNIKPKRFLRSVPTLKLKNKTKKIAQKVGKAVAKHGDSLSVSDLAEEFMPEMVNATSENWECSLCTNLVKAFAAFVSKHKDTFAEAIIEATTTFCERLPEPYATKCTDEVSPFMKKFDIEIAMALYLTPGKICPLIVDNCNP